MHKLFGITLALLFLNLLGCKTLSENDTPTWVNNPQHVYPENQYLVAIGEGDTRHAAENTAAANLSRSFEARIESSERLLDQSRETNSSLERTTDFTADIQILSAQTLFNIQHAESWKDDSGRYHAVAYLNRRTTATIYRDKINDQTTRVNFLLATATTTDDLLKKYGTLRAANQHANQAQHLLQQLKIIHPPSIPDATPSYTEYEIHKAFADTAKKIRVQITVDGDEDRRISSTLEELVTRYGFVIGKPAVLKITGTISITDTEQRAKELVFVRYALALQVKDVEDTVLISITEKGREGHTSLLDARNRAFRTVENIIRPNGTQRLDTYFNSLIEPMP